MDQNRYYDTIDSAASENYPNNINFDSIDNDNNESSDSNNQVINKSNSGAKETRLLNKRGQSSNSTISQAFQTPVQRFRQAARKVIHVKRASELANFKWKSSPGDAPGLDIHNPPPPYREIEDHMLGSIIDFSKEKIKIRSDLDSNGFLKAYSESRPEWSKVRWINIEGMSFEVLKIMAVTHKLHPLALEDLFHDSHTSRLTTKLSSFATSLFLSLELITTEDNIKSNSIISSTLWPTLKHHIRDIKSYQVKHPKIHKHRIACQTFHIFLLNDSTVITFFPIDGSILYKPILNQLKHKDTLLRNAQDASMLVESILDVTVDFSMSVVDSYANQIAELEQFVMHRPKMVYTKELHHLKGEVNNFKQRFSALHSVINSLIVFQPLETQPEITQKSRVYLTDVLEHSNTIMGETETLVQNAESLIDLIFNLISYDTNESMKYLAIVSCIFLPVTFIAGVYGTNFVKFDELQTPEGILYFWKICGYSTLVTCILLAQSFWLPPLSHYWLKLKVYFKKRDELPTQTSNNS